MVSSAGDLLAWAQALYGGRVLPPKRLAEMLSFPAPEPESGGSAYGLGVERMQVDRVYFYGHTGSAPGYNSALLYEPVTRMAIVIAINDDPADEALLDILIERVVRAVEGGGAVGFPRSAPAAQSDSE
jgi:D-alanyl-D-alanine carboxypeptidase